jgi:glycosyltransferase involved in cell wall biosynthesis
VRILLVDLESEWRGGQSQALLLLQGLRAGGHDAELLSVSGAALAERARTAGVPLHAASAAFRRPQAARLLRRLLAQRSFDLVHANEAHALTAAWLARVHRFVPLIVSRRVLFPLRRSALSLARYRAATRVIAVSDAVRGELCAAGLDASRIEVVPDGVAPAPPITPEERTRAQARWGISPGSAVAAYVASLTAEKGHALLLDAFADLRRAVPSCRLLLAGSGPLQHSLQEKARAAGLLPAVILAGFVENTRAVYAACDVFLFPSLREGLGSSILEAMSCGLPVVAFDGGAARDILEDGCSGFLVAPAAAPLAAAAARLLADKALARRVGEAAREIASTRFSAARMTEATARVYERLIAAH